MMSSSNREVKARQLWVKTYEELGSVSKTAIKCEIPRSTLYRWLERFRVEGKDGLKGHSKRLNHLAKQKVDEELIQRCTLVLLYSNCAVHSLERSYLFCQQPEPALILENLHSVQDVFVDCYN